MEFLKQTTVFCILCLGALHSKAQLSGNLQKAFQNSYTHEGKKQYSEAISDVMPYYNESNYETNLRIGWLSYLAKNYTSSQIYYSRAVAIKPSAIEARFGFVQPLSLLGNWDKVLEQYTSIIKVDPQNTQANYWIGVISYNRKQYANAIKFLNKVVTLYPFDYDGNHMLGWAYFFSGKKTEAKSCFEKALLIKPSDSSSTDGLNRSK
ncbi:MAG: tetratricopeptide repeat protein [Pedobacter sp.]|nr:tetratricopeptide repeat protein [Pedobacter sp.]